VGRRLLARRVGFRSLLDVIGLDASLVRGSHGRLPQSAEHGPLLISGRPELVGGDALAATDVRDLLLRHMGVPAPSPA
jgi:hypothetical protein